MSKKFIIPDSNHPSMSNLKKRIEKEKPYPTFEELKAKLKLVPPGVKTIPMVKFSEDEKMQFPIINMKEVSKDKFEPEYEVHVDGVKEIPCDFCDEACGNDWCPTKEKE